MRREDLVREGVKEPSLIATHAPFLLFLDDTTATSATSAAAAPLLLRLLLYATSVSSSQRRAQSVKRHGSVRVFADRHEVSHRAGERFGWFGWFG